MVHLASADVGQSRHDLRGDGRVTARPDQHIEPRKGPPAQATKRRAPRPAQVVSIGTNSGLPRFPSGILQGGSPRPYRLPDLGPGACGSRRWRCPDGSKAGVADAQQHVA